MMECMVEEVLEWREVCDSDKVCDSEPAELEVELGTDTSPFPPSFVAVPFWDSTVEVIWDIWDVMEGRRSLELSGGVGI